MSFLLTLHKHTLNTNSYVITIIYMWLKSIRNTFQLISEQLFYNNEAFISYNFKFKLYSYDFICLNITKNICFKHSFCCTHGFICFSCNACSKVIHNNLTHKYLRPIEIKQLFPS